MERFFDTLSGVKTAFIGAGVAHRDLITLFAGAGARVTLCDRRSLDDFGAFGDELMARGVRLSLGENYLDGLAGQELILRTPGFDFSTPELQAAARGGARVTSEIELFLEHCPAKTFGITGSDGKTTTSSLIAAILEEAGHTVHLGGNIGRAMLPLADSVKPTDLVVVELSSFQLISMRLSPKVAMVTNITPNHLDHHKDMQEYIDAKRNILKYQNPGELAVLGLENDVTRSFFADVQGECRWFSRLRPVDNGACLDAEGRLCLAQNGDLTPVIPKSEVLLRGEHNIENLLAAFAATRDYASAEAMRAVAARFVGVPHRIEPVRNLDGVWWYNDSIATSPSRVVAGLRSFPQKLILIAGGYDKNIPFAPMAQDVAERVRLLILTGPAADKIEAAVRAEAGAGAPEIRRAGDLSEAVEIAYGAAKAGDAVLLSPGCASLDAYPNFEARGDHFRALVEAL